MALSSNGRRLLAEVLGCVALLIVGAVALTHRQQTTQIAASVLGLKLSSPAAASHTVDDGIDRSSVSGRRRVELESGGNGHFFAEADVNGRSITAMVDTGASMVALTYDDARRVGVLPRDSEFVHRANTANGITKFAAIEIDRLSIGGIEVRNVRAAVMEDGKLDTTLLGMSFLGRVGSVAMRSGRLVLEE